MAQTIRLKRSSVPGKKPENDHVDYGELAVNTHDGSIYLKRNTLEFGDEVVEISNTLVDDAKHALKIDKVEDAVEGNIAAFLGDGNIYDTAVQITDLASSEQGALAETALQPTDNVSLLNNDAGYLTSSNISIDDMTDVDLTGITPGQILKWDGAQFIAGDDETGGSVPTSINDLTDVDITGITLGQILKWNGTEFIAADDNSGEGGGIPEAPVDGTIYGRQNTTWIGAASLAQGARADTALQSGDNISELNNDAGYITSSTGIESIVEDTTPQLGGNLDTNGFEINSSSGSIVISTSNISLNNIAWPSTDGTAGQVLTTDGSGALYFTDAISSEVDSVFGRLGDVTAENDDYNSTQITNNSAVLGINVTEALDNLKTATDSSLKTGDDISRLNNDSGYITALDTFSGSYDDLTDVPTTFNPAPHTHVKADITDFNDADYATSAQGLLANTAIQPGNRISLLNNDAGYMDELFDDLAPRLAGVLNTNGHNISSITGGSLKIESDNLQLASDNGGGVIQLGHNPVNGSDLVKINGLTFPIADGSVGQVITTDGEGVLNFTTFESGAQEINDLTDVDTSGITVGQILEWNGFGFIPGSKDSGAGAPVDEAPLNGQQYVRQTGNWTPLGSEHIILAEDIELRSETGENIISYSVSPPTDSLFPNTTFTVIGEATTGINIDSVLFDPLKMKNDTAIQGYFADYSGVTNLLSISPDDKVIVGDSTTQVALRSLDSSAEPVVRQGTFGATVDHKIYHEGNLDISGIDDALQSGDNISELVNNIGYITLAQAGETNTASSLGSGESVYGTKVGSDLRFKSLVAGNNVTFTSDNDSITINSTGGGAGGEVEEAPEDGKQYGRQNKTWTEVQNGTSTFESIRVNYNGLGTISSVQDASSGITGTSVEGSAYINFEFIHNRPPSSIVYYGYKDLGAPGYGYKMVMPASASLINEVHTGGSSGNPAELLTNMTPGKIRLHARTNETLADSGEHAFIFFLF